MKPFGSKWDSYKKMVVPKDAPGVQIDETKKAFYAGASALMNLIMYGDEKLLIGIQGELDAYVFKALGSAVLKELGGR